MISVCAIYYTHNNDMYVMPISYSAIILYFFLLCINLQLYCSRLFSLSLCLSCLLLLHAYKYDANKKTLADRIICILFLAFRLFNIVVIHMYFNNYANVSSILSRVNTYIFPVYSNPFVFFSFVSV